MRLRMLLLLLLFAVPPPQVLGLLTRGSEAGNDVNRNRVVVGEDDEASLDRSCDSSMVVSSGCVEAVPVVLTPVLLWML